MNFIDPIPNAEFQLSIVCAILCVLFIILYVGVKLTNRIEELRADMLQEDEAVMKYADKSIHESEQILLKRIYNLETNTQNIKFYLNRPLYEVGNTIWFNDGANGKPGVYEDIKAKILEVKGDGKSEPYYLVKHAVGTEIIPQSLIVAWTN